MSSVFTKIVNGELPSYKVAETEDYLAFLDVRPLVEGHVLVIPKQETDFIFDIDDIQLSGLMLFAKRVAKAQKMAVKCKRIGIAVIGLEVPHAHIHLIPMNKVEDMNFANPKLHLSENALTQMAQKIKAAFI